MRKLAVLLTTSAMVFGGACATLGRAAFQNPVVHLRTVTVRGLGLSGGSLDVKLSVYNPNHYRLDASRVDYTVNLAGDQTTIAKGTLDNRFTVQDNDSTEITIPVNFTYAGLGAAGKSILDNGTIDYHVLGDVVVATAVGPFTVPYSTTGRFTTTGLAR